MTAFERLSKMYPDSRQIVVWGHRGAKAYAPMNTLPSFQLALDQGAQGIELDVHRSKDGYPVILHDFTVNSTTNGEGRITDMTLAEIKALDAGSYFGEAYKGVQIPTLNEVFELVGQRMIVNVEIKSESMDTDGVEQLVADCIQRHSMEQHVVVSSFNALTLKRFRQVMPQIPLGYLHQTGYESPGYGTESAILREDCEAWHPNHYMVDESYMQQAKALNKRVNVWTVNDPQRARELRDLGVDSLITDAPDVILKAVAE
jgi:glycerophosphoryl diester phosphodiesterase